MKSTIIKKHVNTSSVAVLAAAGVFAIVAALAPAAQAAQTSTQVEAEVGSVISLLTSNGTVSLNLTPSAAGVQSTASDTVTVSTNNPAGFNLGLAETTASSALVSGSNNIPATSGTQTTPTALAANTWGYRVDGVGGFGAGTTTAGTSAPIGSVTYAAVPATASPNTLKTTNSTATNNTTTVWYSAAVNTGTPSGTYTNSVTYTALPN